MRHRWRSPRQLKLRPRRRSLRRLTQLQPSRRAPTPGPSEKRWPLPRLPRLSRFRSSPRILPRQRRPSQPRRPRRRRFSPHHTRRRSRLHRRLRRGTNLRRWTGRRSRTAGGNTCLRRCGSSVLSLQVPFLDLPTAGRARTCSTRGMPPCHTSVRSDIVGQPRARCTVPCVSTARAPERRSAPGRHSRQSRSWACSCCWRWRAEGSCWHGPGGPRRRLDRHSRWCSTSPPRSSRPIRWACH